MSQTTFKLQGWNAVVIGVVLLAIVGFRVFSARSSFDDQGQAVLREWVATEIQRDIMDRAGDSPEDLQAQAAALLEAADVQFASVKAKGTADDLVVRVELAPNPSFPPGTEPVRFYRMEYSSLTGWRHRGNATAVSYYLKLF